MHPDYDNHIITHLFPCQYLFEKNFCFLSVPCYCSGFPFPIGGGGVYADPAGIFMAENPIFQKKNAFLADFAARLSAIIKQNLWGCQGGKPFRFSIPAKGRDADGSILRIEAPRLFEGGPIPLRQLLRSRRLSSNDSRILNPVRA